MSSSTTRTVDSINIRADPDVVFRAAADTRHWPDILPHYRFVRVLEENDNGQIVEMAARRGFIPVKWTSLQWVDPRWRRVYYRHIRGATKGMYVEWIIEPRQDGTRVEIVHELSLTTPLVRSAAGRFIVARFFIHHIAGQTFRHIKRFVEMGGVRECDVQS